MSTIEKDKTFAILRERNIVKVEVEFSGGNDEGGADAITGFQADGTEVNLMYKGPAWRNVYFDRDGEHDEGWVVGDRWDFGSNSKSRPATPEEIVPAELAEMLEAPVYDAYGSFAGDFYVNGTLTWDVEAGTVTMSGDEEIPASEHFTRDF